MAKIYVIVSENNGIWGVSKDYYTAVEEMEQLEWRYGIKFWVVSAKNLDVEV